MKEVGRMESEREIAQLRKRNQTKSPVKENVRKFEGKSESPVQENVRKFNSRSPASDISRGKSPNPSNQRPNTLYNPTRSKSPGGVSSPMRSKSPGVQSTQSVSPGLPSPVRSKSPGISSPLRSKSPRLPSPLRSKSPGIQSPQAQSKSPGFSSPVRSKSPLVNTQTRSESPVRGGPKRSKSPGVDPYARSKSPGVNSKHAKSPLSKSPTRSQSPGMIGQSPASSPTKSLSPSKWKKSDNGWTKESPIVAETVDNYVYESVPNVETTPMVGDADLSWYFDNIELVTDTKAKETYSAVQDDVWSGIESPGNSPQREQRFRNSLNYNISAWDDEDNEDRPKKADEFIQRLCDQVRNHVEYMCGMDFIKYKALSYKVRVAGAEGIFYYIKVNVWQDYCLHLRIFSHKNELKAVPTLQAILERAQPDNGNIEFF
ncbi:neurofilament heavy polypeptide-like [Dendronephthya gigantea]|uniref:neurofilament heavy polypeptide-like n=1 Tax=Dendronephthya gigantea TaxID=151771 RepID=UPI00106DCD14|nr:neurofilament heavy polypeptide-like [Dendronephthya gigantea]